MATKNDPPISIPVVEERASIHKRKHETDRVRVRTVVEQALERVGAELEHEDVQIERVPVDQEVTAAPEVREENGVLIVPVLEEVLVVQKRLVLKEELRITRRRSSERVEQAVSVRRMRADVERVPTDRDGRRAEATPMRDEDEAAGEVVAVRRGPRLRRKPPLTRR